MNLNFYSTKDYENISNWTLGENKPNQTQFKPIKANFNAYQTQFKPNHKTTPGGSPGIICLIWAS